MRDACQAHNPQHTQTHSGTECETSMRNAIHGRTDGRDVRFHHPPKISSQLRNAHAHTGFLPIVGERGASGARSTGEFKLAYCGLCDQPSNVTGLDRVYR